MSRIFTLCFTLLALTLLGQKNFVEGFITTLNGEQVNGLIDYREWVKTPHEIRFQRHGTAGKTEILTPYDIAGFKINYKQEEYIRAVVGVNNEPISDKEILEFELRADEIPAVQLDIDTIFLLVLVKGQINLYFYEDDNDKQHYFIQKGNGKIEELIYRIVRSRSPSTAADLLVPPNSRVYGANVAGGPASLIQSVTMLDYRKQLLDAMPGCPAILSDINRSLYSYTLLKLVNKYNTCVNHLTYVKPKDKANFDFYGYAGGNQPFIAVKDIYNNSDKQLNTTPGISVGAGFDIGIIRTNNRLSVGLEANYARSSAQHAQLFTPLDGLNQNIDYQIDLWGLRFNALLKYIIIKGKLNPYVKIGVGKSSYSTSNFQRTETLQSAPFTSTITERNLITSELHGIAGIGFKVNNFFLESRFESGNDINRFTGEDLEMTRLSVLVGYALTLNNK